MHIKKSTIALIIMIIVMVIIVIQQKYTNDAIREKLRIEHGPELAKKLEMLKGTEPYSILVLDEGLCYSRSGIIGDIVECKLGALRTQLTLRLKNESHVYSVQQVVKKEQPEYDVLATKYFTMGPPP